MNDKLTKRVVIDWLSVSFDFVDIYKVRHKTFNINENNDLHGLLAIFSLSRWRDLPNGKAVNGYLECKMIGEHIKLMWGGDHTMNGNEKYTMQLLMSGEACREFEHYMDGDWSILLSYFYQRDSSIKRLDIAIDDFEAKEISIYDIEPFIRNGDYTSPMHNKMGMWSIGPVNGFQDASKGYSLTFGSPGSTQLQIYDKNLERVNRDKADLDTEIWYRYEMRFVDEKAKKVVETYLVAVDEDDSETFMNYARGLLYSMLDLKDPTDLQANRSRRRTDTKWLAFLDSIVKIDIKSKQRIDTTIDKMLGWRNHSLPVVEAKTYAALDEKDYLVHMVRQRIKGLKGLDGHDLTIINNYRVEKGKQPMTSYDVMKLIDRLKEEHDQLTGEEYIDEA